MGLSAHQIGELVAELRPLVRGTTLRALEPLPPRDLVLVLARPGAAGRDETLRLLLSADPEAARVHLQVSRAPRHEGSSDPYYARVAAALEDSTLHALEQVQGDRVVRLSFRRAGQPCAELVAELTGRHANLVLLDGSGGIQASLVVPAPGTAAAARLLPGLGYALPPGRKAAASAPGPGVGDAFPPPAVTGPLSELAPLSARVDAALAGVARARHDEEQRSSLLARLERRLANAEALLAGLGERARSAATAEHLRQDAELLLAHLAAIPRGVREIELPDAFAEDSPPRRIPLDPGLSARRNAEKLFARYKKLLRTQQKLPEELRLAQETRERVALLLERASSEDPQELEAEAIAAGLLAAPQEEPRKKPRRPEPRRPFLSFQALRGSEIRVGRSAADNDRLTFREARGNDVWLHTADVPGSHVILRLEKGAEPDDEEVLDAAHLAVHFSPLRGTPRADVHVARQKEVHKPRKAPAGLVTLSGGKVLRVRMEAARLERLLTSRARSGVAPGEA